MNGRTKQGYASDEPGVVTASRTVRERARSWMRAPALSVLLAALAAIAMLGAPCAYAAEMPDLTRTGTIHAGMTCDGEAVPGGTLTLYRVGDVVVDNGYRFELNDRFAGSGVPLDDVESADTAEVLAAYAEDDGIEGVTQDIDGAGDVSFADVEAGLYLIVQHEPAEGYEPVNPFLVSMPMRSGDTYLYDVDASPKMELEQAPTYEKPGTPSEVPQSGSAVAPVAIVVAVLVVCGVALLVIRRRRRA